MAPNVNIIIRRPGPGVEEEEDFVQTAATASISVSEIEEEHSSELFEISTGSGLPSLGLDTIREEIDGNSLFSFDFHNNSGEISAVYVAIGKYSEESSSMDALVWTITHAVSDPTTTIVFLIHVFPQTKFIPMPLGMIPASQVNPEQRENYMAQETSKRRDFLQKFLNLCSTSKVKVDTILIESDMEAKAILELIPILNITKLVLGTSKSNLRRMRSSSKRGTTAATTEAHILRDAPDFCEVNIICEGKEIAISADPPIPMAESPSPSPLRRSPQPHNHVQLNHDSFTCCFKPKVVS